MNSTWEYWLLGFALAVDCFSVSVASGIAARKLLLRPMAKMTFLFGFFQGGMTLLGYCAMSLSSGFIVNWDHWVAFAILVYLGARMIISDFKEGEDNEGQCRMLTMRNIITMSVATSIDALAVGLSLACSELQHNIMVPVSIIAFCSLALSIIGLTLGIRVGKVLKIHAEVIGGIVLVFIGIKILVEHL